MNQFALINAQNNVAKIKEQMADVASDAYELKLQIEDLQRRMAECPAQSDRQVAWLKRAEFQLTALEKQARKLDKTLDAMDDQREWHQKKADRLTSAKEVLDHEYLGPEKLAAPKARGNRKGRSAKSLRDQGIRAAMKGSSQGSGRNKGNGEKKQGKRGKKAA